MFNTKSHRSWWSQSRFVGPYKTFSLCSLRFFSRDIKRLASSMLWYLHGTRTFSSSKAISSQMGTRSPFLLMPNSNWILQTKHVMIVTFWSTGSGYECNRHRSSNRGKSFQVEHWEHVTILPAGGHTTANDLQSQIIIRLHFPKKLDTNKRSVLLPNFLEYNSGRMNCCLIENPHRSRKGRDVPVMSRWFDR